MKLVNSLTGKPRNKANKTYKKIANCSFGYQFSINDPLIIGQFSHKKTFFLSNPPTHIELIFS